jgi:hypothetical protein
MPARPKQSLSSIVDEAAASNEDPAIDAAASNDGDDGDNTAKDARIAELEAALANAQKDALSLAEANTKLQNDLKVKPAATTAAAKPAAVATKPATAIVKKGKPLYDREVVLNVHAGEDPSEDQAFGIGIHLL